MTAPGWVAVCVSTPPMMVVVRRPMPCPFLLVGPHGQVDRPVMGCGRTCSYEVTPCRNAHVVPTVNANPRVDRSSEGHNTRPGNFRVRPSDPRPHPSSLENSESVAEDQPPHRAVHVYRLTTT